ncbi:ribonuclease H-like [Bufo bufo]|uniref:ribonuclease H-like n=1 Tax=Bufo bufo TaxID=8384 RepID=UPI001ABEB13B|nr:ribonuclease H-like [Bufo bufo]
MKLLTEYFVDGSRFMGEDGQFHNGYAVVTQHKVGTAEQLPPRISAQEVELKALTEVCKMVKGKKLNIYMDSRYAFGIAHDYGPIWRARGFLTSTGQPIKNKDSVLELMNSLLPEEVAIIKVKAHTRHTTVEAKGNDRADKAAKQAALQPVKTVPTLKPEDVSVSMLQKMTDQAPPEEGKITLGKARGQG